MDATPIISASLFIGSSIFLYIIGFLAIMAVGAYLTYQVSPKGKKRREEHRERRRK